MRNIKLARNIGFCSGVRRAIDITSRTLAKTKNRVYSLGPVIHNPEVIRQLEKKGLRVAKSLDSVPPYSTLILPSHGSPRKVLQACAKKKIRFIDVTCPYVSLVQRTCGMLFKQGLEVVIVGNNHHPEIKALLDIAKGACPIEKAKDIKKGSFSHKRIGIISQTTQSRQALFELVNTVLQKNPLVKEVHVFNTICRDTINRQEEAARLARRVDSLLVVGSRTSANTRRLFEIGRKINRRTYLVENKKSALAGMLKGSRRVGLISGASTPGWLVKSIIEEISEATTYGSSRERHKSSGRTYPPSF